MLLRAQLGALQSVRCVVEFADLRGLCGACGVHCYVTLCDAATKKPKGLTSKVKRYKE